MWLLKKFSCLALNVFILLICSNNIWAITPGERIILVKLNKIVLEKLSENGSDELYFSIAKYSNKNKSSLVRIPEFPMYWRAKDLNALHNVILVEQTIAVGEEMQFILSLMEADAPPFDPDDHIGSIQLNVANKAHLNISNKAGHLQQQWQQPNLIDQTDVHQIKDNLAEFSFAGAGGKYLVKFLTEVK